VGKANAKGRSRGAFVMVQHSLLNSPAWLDLSGVGVKLLLHLMKLSEGNNGWGHGKGEPGDLYLGERAAAQAIGVSRNTVSRAFAELIDHGFLRIVKAGHFQVKVRLATAWRLTFQPYPRSHQGPTNEWRDWQPPQPPEQRSRAQKLNGTGSKIGPTPEKEAFTGSKTAPVKSVNGEKQPKLTGSIIAPHLDMPWEGKRRGPANGSSQPQVSCENCGEPFERTKATRRFCGTVCKERAKQRRHYQWQRQLGDSSVPGWAA
jgi:hypothetical protein